MVQTAVRTWQLSPADSARWPRLRDSVAALASAIAGGAGPCAIREVPSAGTRLSAWFSWGYGLAVNGLERSPGGHELRLEVNREDTLCTLSRQRTRSVYSRTDSAGSGGADSVLGMEAVLEDAARAAGLPVLRTSALPTAMRELRLSPGGSGIGWQPIPLVRLIEWPNSHSVSGELFFYWSRSHDSSGRRAHPSWAYGQSGCRTVQSTGDWAACRVDVQPGTTWRVVADSLQALGIWELPLGAATERRGSDTPNRDGVLGEVLIGDRYGRFMYDDLNQPSGKGLLQVSAAADLVRNLPTR